MGKVRVPKEHRPPTRFGIVKGWAEEGKRFKVKGQYRSAQVGEWYWDETVRGAIYAYYGPTLPRVILEPVPDTDLSKGDQP